MMGPKDRRLFPISPKPSSIFLFVGHSTTFEIFHWRKKLGHPNFDILQYLLSSILFCNKIPGSI